MQAIKKKALDFAENSGINNFVASTGWFYNFLNRNKFSRRIGTHAATKLTEDYLQKIDEFLFEIKN